MEREDGEVTWAWLVAAATCGVDVRVGRRGGAASAGQGEWGEAKAACGIGGRGRDGVRLGPGARRWQWRGWWRRAVMCAGSAGRAGGEARRAGGSRPGGRGEAGGVRERGQGARRRSSWGGRSAREWRRNFRWRGDRVRVWRVQVGFGQLFAVRVKHWHGKDALCCAGAHGKGACLHGKEAICRVFCVLFSFSFIFSFQLYLF